MTTPPFSAPASPIAFAVLRFSTHPGAQFTRLRLHP